MNDSKQCVQLQDTNSTGGNGIESSPLREGGRLGPSPTILKDFQLILLLTCGGVGKGSSRE
jgi:hypothetical protein